MEKQLKDGGFWKKGCPVVLSNLRLLTVTHRDFHGHDQTGQLIVNKTAAPALEGVFRQPYKLHFPIRHMRLADAYGPKHDRPRDGDVSASFACRQAVPSPCAGAGGPRQTTPMASRSISTRWRTRTSAVARPATPRLGSTAIAHATGAGWSRDG